MSKAQPHAAILIQPISHANFVKEDQAPLHIQPPAPLAEGESGWLTTQHDTDRDPDDGDAPPQDEGIASDGSLDEPPPSGILRG